MDSIIKNGTIATDSEIFHADIGIEGEVISHIGRNLTASSNAGAKIIDATGKIVVPGAIDGHTHFGYVSTDDFDSGTRAASSGGTTTIINFARHIEGMSLAQSLEQFRKMAESKAVIDYSAHSYIRFPRPEIFDEIEKLVASGNPTFKVAMTHRKEGFMLDDGAILSVMKKVAQFGGLLGIHCENNSIIEHTEQLLLSEEKRSVNYFGESRPIVAEVEAIRRALTLAQFTGASIYVVHLSTKIGADAISDAVHRSLKVFAETCPHFLMFTDEAYSRPDGEFFVMTPPLRKKEDREALWEGLSNGRIKTVASDHATFSSEKKREGRRQNDFTKIPHGVTGTGVIIPILYSEGVAKGRLSLMRMVQVTSYNPARLFGLYPRKGTIAVGSDADLVIIDPSKKVQLTPENLHSNLDHSIYDEITCHGFPTMTISRGEVVFDGENVLGKPGRGIFQMRRISPEISI